MLRLRDAELFYPSNCETPIAARAAFDSNGAAVQMELDFLHRGTPSWNIHVDTDGGQLGLLAGGSVMEVDGRARQTPAIAEYPALYAHFAGLVRSGASEGTFHFTPLLPVDTNYLKSVSGASEVDLSPLQLVADAFLCGRRTAVEPFIE